MEPLSKYRTLFSFGVAIFVIIIAVAAIFWARGFKPNFSTGEIDRTGLIVANSTPKGASVYLNDRLTSATDTSIAFLDPGIYAVRIEKEGYFPWEKEVFVRADLASEINALLFPKAPELKPLTSSGAFNPTLSPDNTKIIFGAPGETGGVFMLPLIDSPFAFRQNARLLAVNTANLDFSLAKFIWNPNSEEFVARFENNEGIVTANILLNANNTNQQPRDITASLNATILTWQALANNQAANLSILAPTEVTESTSEASLEIPSQFTSANLINYYPDGLVFSPDEEKILYLSSDSLYHVFDLNEELDVALPTLTNLQSISWYPDSDHLVIAEENQISIIEADGKNKTAIFSGSFENGFVFAHPAKFRIIVLTTLTQPDSTSANLYSINLK